MRLAGRDPAHPSTVSTVYTPRWGSTPVPLAQGRQSRRSKDGHVSSRVGRFERVHRSPLLVAQGDDAVAWLKSLHRGDRVRVHARVDTVAPHPFRLAYAVGSTLVIDGVPRSRMKCRRSHPQPARTAIGFRKHRTRLILAVVDDRRDSPVHGLASVQMARLMADLGAEQAFLLDGGGSTEMLSRMTRTAKRTSIRNYPARTTSGRCRWGSASSAGEQHGGDTGLMRVTVRVSPGSRRTEVGGRYGEAEPAVLVVRVSARAVDGKANGAVVAALADAFGVPTRDVRIVTGQRGRTKLLEIEGGDPERLAALVAAELT